jgi:ABC-type phosphonate transport system ATPase subunit
MIEAKGLAKRYGDKTAVNGLSFTVRPGMVTGFLGPNGAGKPVTGLRPLFRRRCRWSVICNPAMRSRSRWLVFLITVSWPASR